jgi:hypothetical protein
MKYLSLFNTLSTLSKYGRKGFIFSLKWMRRGPWYYSFVPLSLLLMDSTAIILGLLLFLACLLLLLPAEIIAAVTAMVGPVGVATYLSTMSGIFGFQLVEPSWFSLISEWSSWGISCLTFLLNPLNWVRMSVRAVFDGVEFIYQLTYAFNSFVYYTTITLFGYFGTLVVIKLITLTTVIKATVALWVAEGASFPIWVGTVLCASFYHMVLSPVMDILDNPSLANIALALIPDPAAVWNLFININCIPWRVLRSLITITMTPTISASVFLTRLLNAIIDDFTILPWIGNDPMGLDWLMINPDTVNRILFNHVFNPMLNTTNSMLRNIQSLRSLWR